MTEAQISAAEQARVRVLKDILRSGIPADGGSYDAVADVRELRDADCARLDRLADGDGMNSANR